MELENTAKAKLDLCHNMRTELERKLAELIVGQATIRKQYQTVSEKNMKNKVAQTAYVAKCREKYEARCLELQQLMSSRTGLPPKEVEKIRLKIETAQASAKKADLEYQDAVAKLKEIHTKWEQDWRGACEVGLWSFDEGPVCWNRKSSSSFLLLARLGTTISNSNDWSRTV